MRKRLSCDTIVYHRKFGIQSVSHPALVIYLSFFVVDILRSGVGDHLVWSSLGQLPIVKVCRWEGHTCTSFKLVWEYIEAPNCLFQRILSHPSQCLRAAIFVKYPNDPKSIVLQNIFSGYLSILLFCWYLTFMCTGLGVEGDRERQ